MEGQIKITPKFVPVDSPAMTAEKLLKSILPEELYLQLSALGHFEFEVNGHKYDINRTQKTKVTMDGKIYSCCMDVDNVHHAQDKIAAEYLLIINDEKKYLTTANLTQIGVFPPSDSSTNFRWGVAEIALNAQYRAGELRRLDELRRADELRGLLPRYELFGGPFTPEGRQRAIQPRRNIISPEMIAYEALRILCTVPPMDRPYQQLPMRDWRSRGLEDHIYMVEFIFTHEELSTHMYDFSRHIIQPSVEVLSRMLRDLNIVGCVELHLPTIPDSLVHRAGMRGDGRSIRLIGSLDTIRRIYECRLDICLITQP